MPPPGFVLGSSRSAATRRILRPRLTAPGLGLPGEAARLDPLIAVVGVVVFGVVVADAANHDLILFDRDLDRPVTGPVLGVDRIVLDGGVEPQPVALFAVVERRLERRGLAPGAAAPAAAASPALGRRLLGFVLFVLFPLPLRRLPRLARPRPRARRRSARRPRLGDRSHRRSRRPRRARGRLGLEALLALERLDLLHGHLELVGDPCVGASLAHPATNSVQLWS